jgi:hypothetical protein
VERQEQVYRDHGFDVPVHPCLPGQIREGNNPKVNSRQTPPVIPPSNGHSVKRAREGASQPPINPMQQIMSPGLQSHFHQILERQNGHSEGGPSKRPRMEQNASGSPAMGSSIDVGKRTACILCGGNLHLVTECHLIKRGPAALKA